jgi:hypothetical protein
MLRGSSSFLSVLAALALGVGSAQAAQIAVTSYDMPNGDEAAHGGAKRVLPTRAVSWLELGCWLP